MKMSMCTWGFIFPVVVLCVCEFHIPQVVAQKTAHPVHASIILSLEAVFAVIGGWLILHEGFTGRMLAGCSLMLAGMVVVQVRGRSQGSE